MKKFNELTEKEKITRTKYTGITIGFIGGLLTMMFFDLYLTSNNKKVLK